MIEQWKLARYIIDAKKGLDSLWFISKHLDDLYDFRKLCYDRRNDYYINVCAVLDKTVCKNSNDKKSLKQSQCFVNRIYTERDKYYAHKDNNYVPSYPYSSIEAEVFSLQFELENVVGLCEGYLPDNITLNFVCYDARLFRVVEKINPRDEEQIKQRKYPLYNSSVGCNIGFSKKILYDIDDLKSLTDEECKEYCVMLDNGLTFEEGLQSRQDACIKFNVLYDKNIWVSLNKESYDIVMKYRKSGFFDKFDIIQFDNIWNAVISGELSKPAI